MSDLGLVLRAKALDKKIQDLETSNNKEDIQLRNWLVSLKEYTMRDIPMRIKEVTMAGRYICPKCGKAMKLGIESGYCNECGQAITRECF